MYGEHVDGIFTMVSQLVSHQLPGFPQTINHLLVLTADILCMQRDQRLRSCSQNIVFFSASWYDCTALHRVIILPQIIIIPHTPSLTFTFTILKVNLVIDDSCYTYETESSISKCDYEARLNIAENDLNSDLRTPAFATFQYYEV